MKANAKLSEQLCFSFSHFVAAVAFVNVIVAMVISQFVLVPVFVVVVVVVVVLLLLFLLLSSRDLSL